MIRVSEVCIVEYGNRLSEEESPSYLSSRMDRSLKREAVRQFVADSIHRMSDPTQCCRFASFWLEKVSGLRSQIITLFIGSIMNIGNIQRT